MKETLKSIANVIFLGKAVKDTHYLEIPDDERIRRADLYRAVDYRKPEVLKALLEAGADPNECLGVEGWISNNPLQMVIRRCDSTYSRMKRGEAIPDPLPDVAMMNILLEAGADIDRRPYVWSTVVLGDNMWIKHIQDSTTQKANGEFIKTQEEADEEKHLYVYDNNRLLKAFLEAGANPDKPGHPVPYSTAKEYLYISDEEANTFFAQGTRAINEAIKKGILWESQVDLLLQYTTLGQDSLAAARESGDPAMVEKINRLWEEQNK